MMSRMTAFAALAVALTAAPPALAQNEGDPAPGNAPVTAGEDVQVLVEIDQPSNLDERGGPARRELAIMQTTLLNRFSELGFTEVEEFRREGESYVAEAVSAEGDEVTVVIDPMAGTIVARR